jgi:hypothetical protein
MYGSKPLYNKAVRGSFSSSVPRESWLLLTASGSVPMFSLHVATTGFT